MNRTIIAECTHLNFAGNLPFPENARRLATAGVRSYDVDLVRLEKVHYGCDGETFATGMPLADVPAIAQEFSSAGVVAALRAVQGGEIDYPEFLRRIMRAGVARYIVYLGGRKALYCGRDGESYTEAFPDALQLAFPQAA
jgi:uncharacterized protein YbcV (DUF1398 family)